MANRRTLNGCTFSSRDVSSRAISSRAISSRAISSRAISSRAMSDVFRASPEWCVLDEAELHVVEEAARCREYDTGEVIFYEGDKVRGVYFVESGLIGIRKADPEGNSTLLKVANPGDTLGYRPLASGQPHRASGEALKPSLVCFIEANKIMQIVQDNPALGLNFLSRAARELGDAEEKFHESVTLSARARFAHLLIVLQDRYGSIAQDGSLHVTLPVSRSELADMLGIRRESISRIIRDLEDTGISHFTERKVVIPNPNALLNEFLK